jgi:hypothetical protein
MSFKGADLRGRGIPSTRFKTCSRMLTCEGGVDVYGRGLFHGKLVSCCLLLHSRRRREEACLLILCLLILTV